MEEEATVVDMPAQKRPPPETHDEPRSGADDGGGNSGGENDGAGSGYPSPAPPSGQERRLRRRRGDEEGEEERKQVEGGREDDKEAVPLQEDQKEGKTLCDTASYLSFSSACCFSWTSRGVLHAGTGCLLLQIQRRILTTKASPLRPARLLMGNASMPSLFSRTSASVRLLFGCRFSAS